MNTAKLSILANEARQWLFESAAPLWAERGRSKKGLFAENLTIKGEPTNAPRRILVQSRQVFSFCEVGRLGWRGDWYTPVATTIDYLLAHGRRDDGFYIHKFDSDGHVLEAEAFLYDHAFLLLALAHAGRALKRDDLFKEAHRLTDLIEVKWRHPKGGFLNGDVDPGRRLQNPHMHMLEAFNALHACSGEARWKTLAEEMAGLSRKHFIDRVSGALLEYFTDDLLTLPGVDGRLVEPGHCFEWTWLFERLAEENPEWVDLSDRLTDFARRFGIDASRGVAINEVQTDGAMHDPTARLWPQTERLKAALARRRRTNSPEESDEAARAYSGLKLYLATPTPGTWRDKLQSNGAWVDEPSPASSFYHITCALSELISTEKSEN